MTITTPSIILVRPQLPENIGMTARAMDNFGFKNLILVNPREKWPNEISLNSSANSSKIILRTKIYKSLNEALKKFHYVIATSNRKRFLRKPHQKNIDSLYNQIPKNKKIAIIFGPENSGLSNSDLMLADIILNINTANSNKSLNLSHAVLLMCYTWRDYFFIKNKSPKNNQLNSQKANTKEFLSFIKFLNKQLEEIDFLFPKSKKEAMFNNIQTMFMRTAMSKIEIQTMWGMIKKLRKSSSKQIL